MIVNSPVLITRVDLSGFSQVVHIIPESLFIAESIARESYLDFSQALIQLGVQEAIALVGSIEISLYKDEYGYRHISNVEHKENATETYIVWVKDL